MEQLRIVQQSKNEFIVQKKITENRIVKIYWLWDVRKNIDVWKTLNRKGLILTWRNINSHEKENKPFKTLEEALAWIEDYKKYPIYYNAKGEKQT